jgi:hypothetical protein
MEKGSIEPSRAAIKGPCGFPWENIAVWLIRSPLHLLTRLLLCRHLFNNSSLVSSEIVNGTCESFVLIVLITELLAPVCQELIRESEAAQGLQDDV